MENDLLKIRPSIERVLEFLQKTDYFEYASIRNVPALTRLFLKAGFSVKSVHSVHAIKIPGHPALVDERRTLTYAQADREINLAANALQAMGVGYRTPVVISLENSVEYLILWFALLRLGARVVHASWRAKPRELGYILHHSGAKLAIASYESLACLREMQKAGTEPGLRIVHITDDLTDSEDCIRYDRLIARSPSASYPKARREAAETVVYTSGTTGKPKGAVRDLGKFNVVELMRLMERLPMHALDKQLIVTPLYHSAAQAFALLGTALGCTLRIERHFDPAQTLKILEAERIHCMFAIPTMLRRITESRAGSPQLPELRAVISGAGEFQHPLREAVIRFFGAGKVFDFYGATELGWVTLIRGDEMLERKSSVGRALAGQEIGIFSEDGRRLGPGEPGMVYVRSAQTMGGYLNDTDSTDAIRNGNWMTVDDLGHMDEDGYLFLSGRARDMVKSGGVNIYPIEIEEVLLEHPGIREVAVIGVPDPDWGEKLVAVVVPRGEGFDPKDADAFLRTRITSFKIPKQWEIVSELPRNALGKVVKTELRERFGAPAKKTA